MKKMLLSAAAAAIMTSAAAQSTPLQGVTDAINAFVTAADTRNTEQLEAILDPQFRIVMNRLFGSANVDVMTRGQYLGKIASGEFGGEARQSSISQVQVNGNTATAVVKLVGSKLTFTSTLVLVQDAKGAWLIVSDVPVIG